MNYLIGRGGKIIMNKKINYLSILPIYGTAILLFLMYIQMVKKQINKKWFSAFFISCGLFGFLSILGLILLMNFLNSIIDISNFTIILTV
mgnify:CR=1 FL=1